MSVEPTLPSLFDREIDREEMARIRERFLMLNQERLLRTRSVLKARQQLILDLLPLLFHVNHPVLPGYVGADAPCGLDNYRVANDILARVKTHISASFAYRHPQHNSNAIHSIFLMGSCGTVAHAPNSDLDIWLCHRARLTTEAITLLQRKAAAITQWADSLGLEIHIFLMESEQFRRGQRSQLSAEAAGTSQHILLLDEFYRSVVLLAGRYPIWWLVPPEEEANYAEYSAILRSDGLVSSEESIDFGGVSDIPAGEFIGAGVWQLYKAITSPYKAIIKLLLTEAYADEYPNVRPLSLQLKTAVYTGNTDADSLDPYVLVYRKLADYLDNRDEPGRLELLKRAFYFKIGQHASSQGDHGPQWQRTLLASLIKDWQWRNEQLLNLDTQYHWKLRRVSEEHKQLVAELTSSYRFLQSFARRINSPALINSREMNLLGRKLYAAFERKRHKVEWFNRGIAVNLEEQQLFFTATGYGHQRRWRVSQRELDNTTRDEVLNESDHLIALLCWCHCNGLIGSQTRLRIQDNLGGMDERQLISVSNDLRERLPRTAAAGDPSQHNAFTQAKRPVQVMVYVNLSQDGLASLGGSGVPNKDNAFPVNQMELVIINSWGEVSSRAFFGPETLINGLKAFHQILLAERDGPTLKPHFFCANDRQGALTTNLQQLADEMVASFRRTDLTQRFVLKLADGYHILQQGNAALDAQRVDSADALLQTLGRGQAVFSPFMLERHCLPNSILAAISQHSQNPDCQVFLHAEHNIVEAYVSDERGSLVRLKYPNCPAELVATTLRHFLMRTRLEQQAHYHLHFFTLNRQQDRWQAIPIEAQASITSQSAYLEARACSAAAGKAAFDLACNGQIFRYAKLGKQQLGAVARRMVASGAIDLNAGFRRITLGKAGLQTCVYLRYKAHLEELLFEAAAQPAATSPTS